MIRANKQHVKLLCNLFELRLVPSIRHGHSCTITGEVMAAGDEVIDATGKYIYMADLRRLSACHPPVSPTVPTALRSINTPLKPRAWRVEFSAHPDREYVQFPLEGMQQGFQIGFDYSNHSCSSSPRNMMSALAHPEPIDKIYLGGGGSRSYIRPIVGRAARQNTY